MKNLISVIVIFLISFLWFATTGRAQTTPLNYPLSIGDSVEYFLIDTLSIEGDPTILTFTLLSSVEKDTTFNNGKTYKQVVHKNIANLSNGRYWEEYLREDTTGNVYIFYEGEEFLLYDISLPVGFVYPSYKPNHTWEVVEKKFEDVLGITVQVMKLYHKDGSGFIIESRTVAETFGLIAFSEQVSVSFEGTIWAAKIDGNVYGELSIFEEIDLTEFFPLHVGDIWIYKHTNGSITYNGIVRIIGDTVYNNQHYFVRKSVDLMWNNPVIDLVRIDSLARVYRRYFNQQPEKYLMQFTLVVGDSSGVYESNIFKLNEKEISFRDQLEYVFVPDITGTNFIYSRGLGFTYSSGEMSSTSFIGGIIDGVAYGDTSLITSINDKKDEINPTRFKLYQNYPNPFNPSTKIKYTIPSVIANPSGMKQSQVTIKVYDILGNEIATLVNEYKPAGTYEIEFSVEAIQRIAPSSGIYFYQLKAGDFIDTKKMILLK